MPAINQAAKIKKGVRVNCLSRFVLVLDNVNLQTARMPFGSGQDADKRVYIVKGQFKAE
jgi:hypothetical protein